MAESFLEEIYTVSDLICDLKKTVFCIRQNRKTSVLILWKGLAGRLDSYFRDMESVDPELAQKMLQTAAVLRETIYGNPCFAENYIEDNLIPLLVSCIDKMGRIDVTEGENRLVSSKSGYLTLQHVSDQYYCHSINDPMYEAWILARDLAQPQYSEYHILGCGLGYLPFQIWEEMEHSARIILYEVGNTHIDYAMHYGVLDRIAGSDLVIRSFESAEASVEAFLLAKKEGKQDRFFFVEPWVTRYYSSDYNQSVEELIQNDLCMRDNAQRWRINVNKNLSFTQHCSSELNGKFEHDEWVVVAAGPSLGQNLDFLKESVGKRTIIVINTALRKLLNEQIKPNVVISVDPLISLSTHVEGLENHTEDIPLLAGASSSWTFVAQYKGPVYLLYTPAMASCLSESQILENDRWMTGGTVTNFAVEAALRYGAKRIYLVGADMGYPGNQNYTAGVSHNTYEIKGEVETRSNDGGVVTTSKTFNLFRVDMERLIAARPEIEVYNLSKSGAYVLGTFTGKWWENTDGLVAPQDFKEFLVHAAHESTLNWKEKYYILWQILYRAKQMDLAAQPLVKEGLTELFESVFAEYATALTWNAEGTDSRSGQLIYCITTDYGMNPRINEETALISTLRKLPGDKSILVVHTAEAFGAQRRAVRGEIFRKYPSELQKKNTIHIGNQEYAYYQFADYPGDIRLAEGFLQIVHEMPPVEVYADTEYSLVAEYLRRVVLKKRRSI